MRRQAFQTRPLLFVHLSYCEHKPFSECPTCKNPMDTLAGYRKSHTLLVMNLGKNHSRYSTTLSGSFAYNCLSASSVRPTIMIQKSERRYTRSVLLEMNHMSEYFSVGSKVWSPFISCLSYNALPMKVKVDSSKLLPFQARIARRQRYEYSCTNVDHILNNFRVNYRYFTNLFD